MRRLVPIIALAFAASAASADHFPKGWKTLFPTAAKKSTLEPLKDLSFSGPHVGHPFYLGDFDATDGWDVADGLLVPLDANGGNAALELGEAEDFELEGVMDASGTGGLFFLVGVKDGRGYGVWNATMRESGSPWGVFEMRGDRAIDGTAVDENPYEWKREKPFRLAVREGRLTFEIADRTVVDRPVENYTGGRIILGTYETRYGPRSLKVRALRARSR